MARIAGVDLPRQKRVETALTYIYGIGHTRSNRILEKAGIDAGVRVKDLSEEEVSRIAKALDAEGGVEGDLRDLTAGVVFVFSEEDIAGAAHLSQVHSRETGVGTGISARGRG